MIRRTVVITAVLALWAAGAAHGQEPAPPDGAGACPAESPELRAFVELILTSEAKSVDREELDIEAQAGESLRLLGSSKSDYPVCAQLYRRVPSAYRVRGPRAPDTAVFYQLGDRYILALSSLPIREGETRSGPDQFVSFDLELNRLGAMIY